MAGISRMRTGMKASMECWNIGILEVALDQESCKILLAVVVMIGDSSLR